MSQEFLRQTEFEKKYGRSKVIIHNLEASDLENKWTMEGQWVMKGLLAKAARLGCQKPLAAASVELIPCRSDHAKSCRSGTSNLLWNYEVITSD